MLLTITMKGTNTQELGYLLHKNPYRAQCFDLSFGKAYVFYTDVTPEISEPEEKRIPLNTQRMEAVKNAVLESGTVSVLDIGCREGKLTWVPVP